MMQQDPLRHTDTHSSAAAEQLRSGFAALKFAAPLEKDFREAYLQQSIPRGRISGLIALILVLCITCIDLLLGTVSDTINVLRLGLLCPLLTLMLIGTYLPLLRKYYSYMAGGGVLLVGMTANYICIAGALDGTTHLLAGPVLVIVFACLFLGLFFNTAVSIGAALVVGYGAMAWYLGLPLNQLLYTGAMLTAAAVIGSIAVYNLEHALRTTFLETRLLNELAEKDGLTGLYNRRMFDDYMERIWRQSRREGVPLQLIFLDIDYFKLYNDVYGHQAGDDCLKRVAETIAWSAKRPFDLCARYGGEEFVLVVYAPPQDYAETLPEKIRRDVLSLAIPHQGSEIAPYVTISAGVAVVRPDADRSLAGVIQLADEALYEAKQTGRNRVVYRDAAFAEVETGSFRVKPHLTTVR